MDGAAFAEYAIVEYACMEAVSANREQVKPRPNMWRVPSACLHAWVTSHFKINSLNWCL